VPDRRERDGFAIALLKIFGPVRMTEVPAESTNLDAATGWPQGGVAEPRRERIERPRILALVVCAAATAGCGTALVTLPWFGLPDPGGNPLFDFTATSNALSVPPFGSGHIVPASRTWGYFLVVWSTLVIGLAVLAVVASVGRTRREGSPSNRSLLCLMIAALVLVALIIPELTAKIPFGDGPPLTYDFRAVVGLGLAVLSLISASFAWAITRYPWLAYDLATESDCP
jgi:hypothetical protein